MKPAQIILPEVAKLSDNPKACVAGHRRSAQKNNRNVQPSARLRQHTENRAESPDARTISPSYIRDICTPQLNSNTASARKSP
jgi:hypothetical protein